MNIDQIEAELKHLATKEDTALLKVDIQKLRTELIYWIIGTNVAIGAAVVSVMLYLNNQMLVMLQHWKP